MKLSAALAAFALSTALFAGCAADIGESGLDTSAALGDPPLALIVVQIDGNETYEDENGSIPTQAGVNITFDGSTSTGSNLSFGWDFGDGTTMGKVSANSSKSNASKSGSNSTSKSTSNSTASNTTAPAFAASAPQPTNSTTNASKASNKTASDESVLETASDGSVVVHVYEEAGNYTVTLYLTDAGARTDAAKVVMAVGEAKAKAGTVLRTESRKFTDSKACGLTDGIASPAKTSTFEWVFYANETDGTPSAVANVTIKGGPTDTKFIGPDGKEIAKGATIEAKGPFEAGKYKITATSNCAAGSTAAREHKLDASATYVAT